MRLADWLVDYIVYCLLNNNTYHYIEYLVKYQRFLSIYMFLFLLFNVQITFCYNFFLLNSKQKYIWNQDIHV